ncbi:uncharacterized protein I303_101433 [Kwoniella dejecticola CBS 10117]|uniref:Uncharacterized protein n=1 Tax=Kwoniella dejecticola CBS 10117 TaxID=1296121 RepID=A0A1A6AHW8_9TREE|nr:uncharacterized protein I303_01442 [Kwoniella dejecticola CBS 10117]OBR89613.1 hypothetical protein I303_01442 [Kwoniella dejecticola CBS 10117]
MRFFPSSHSSDRSSASPSSPLNEHEDPEANDPGQGQGKWTEYEKEWMDPEGKLRGRGKIWVKKWSRLSQGWDGEGYNRDSEQTAGQDQVQGQGQSGNGEGDVDGHGHGHGHGDRSDGPFTFIPLSGRRGRSNLITDTDNNTDTDHAEPIMDKQRGDVEVRGSRLTGGATDGLQSRNLVILDTILRSSYRAGYNDALKIKPFLPYSTSASSVTSQESSAQPENAVLATANDNNYILLLGLGGIVLASTGLLAYGASNRLKNVERGLQETLALVQLREKNELASVGRLSKEILGIRKLMEDTHSNSIGKRSPTSPQGDLPSAGGNPDPVTTTALVSPSSSLPAPLKSRADSDIGEAWGMKRILEELDLNLKKEFRMIAKDLNGNQVDLQRIKQSVDDILKASSILIGSAGGVPSKASGNNANGTPIPSKVGDEIQKIASETYHLRENLNGLIKIGRELQGEVSLNNQLVKNNLTKSEDIKRVLEALKGQSALKNQHSSEQGLSPSSLSPSSPTSSSPSSPTASTPTPPSTTSTSAPALTSAYGDRLSKSLKPRQDEQEIMPFSDIRKAIEGVKKSYLNDQTEMTKHKQNSAATQILTPTMADPDTPSKEEGTQDLGKRYGPVEGVQFATPLEKVKNPYKASERPPPGPDVVRKEVEAAPLTSNPRAAPMTAGSQTRPEKNDSDDDGGHDDNGPPPPPSSGIRSREPSPYSVKSPESSASPSKPSNSSAVANQDGRSSSRRSSASSSANVNTHGHWWTVHSVGTPQIGLGLNDAWRIKGFGWYHPSDTVGGQRESGQQQGQGQNRLKMKKEAHEEEHDRDRSLGAWAFSRVKSRFDHWPFH